MESFCEKECVTKFFLHASLFENLFSRWLHQTRKGLECHSGAANGVLFFLAEWNLYVTCGICRTNWNPDSSRGYDTHQRESDNPFSANDRLQSVVGPHDGSTVRPCH